MDKLQKGDIAPVFSLPNEDNVEISLQDLSGYTLVLYFYPKDNTSGCTTQAQEFSSLLDEFRTHNTIIVGISPDKCSTHKKFIESKNLKVILLSDETKEIAQKYYAYGKKMMYGKEVTGIIRSTFIIRDGKIVDAFYNVKAKGHAQKILEVIKQDKA